LKAYSGRSITLKFESKTEAKYLSETPTLAVSNPIVTTDNKFPERLVRHIFIITADALRADHLGCYGYNRPTSPSIDLFSKDAVLFENAISQGAATLPSTASLFTSVYPSAHKTDVNNSKLPEIFLTLPEMMTAKGYLTSGFVQNEFLNPPHGLADGFSWYLYDKFGYHTEQRLIPALEWITDMRDLPTFCFFHMLHPHSPYIPPPDIANLFHVSLSPLASSNKKLVEMDSKGIILSKEEREQLMTLYDGEILHLDRIFASFIERLKQLHIYDESLIIFLSDHGESFQEHGRWGHGGTVYQDMIHVPLLIKFPATYKKQGLRISQDVQTMDLTPTILELIGTPQPGFFQGKSLLPLINNTRNTEKTRSIFCEVLNGKLLAVIKEGFKYVYSGQTQKEELYDLRADGGETVDISQKRPDLMKKFRMERTAFFQRASEWRQKHLKGNEGEHITLDEKQTEELRALGYIQ
jgi:arylsulfatase A-like enzyme